MNDQRFEGHAHAVMVGLNQEVRATRAYWYLTKWTEPSTLPIRPDGSPVLLSRVVEDRGLPQFPELMVARWLGRDAQYWAWFDRWWGQRWRQDTYRFPDVAPSAPPDWVSRILQPVIERHGGWDGVWDAVAVWPDGRLSFAEAKRRGGDRLRRSQHAFATAAKSVLGDQVSFTVVEWTAAAPLDWSECGFESERDYRVQRDGYLSDAEFVARWYRWTEAGQPFDQWLRASLPRSGSAWLAAHHLRRPPQHNRYFAAMESLRADAPSPEEDDGTDGSEG